MSDSFSTTALRPGHDWPMYYTAALGSSLGCFVFEQTIIDDETSKVSYALVLSHPKLTQPIRVFSLKDAQLITDALDIVE